MKLLQGTILILALSTFTGVFAQDNKEKAEKKLSWMDKDGNQSISKEEMIAFYEGKTNAKGKTYDAKGIFIGSDHNNDGKITVDELQKKVDWKKVNGLKNKGKAAKTTSKLPKDKTAKKLFWMDTNKDKSVSLSEMKAFFEGKKNKKGETINGEDMFIGWDANDDGKVTADELAGKVDWKKVNSKK